MKVDYKRDLNHNYLILHGEEAVNTASYQVRMLLANAIPCLLPCRLQGIDGESLFYYDITSRQSLAALYEKQKLKAEDLQLIFGQVISALENMAAFLMDPDQLVLVPEYLYMDAEKGNMYFCCLPGYGKGIHMQFRDLGEYLLPKIDHQDEHAVVLGYGVYRKSMEEHFQIDEIKEELYAGTENREAMPFRGKEENLRGEEKTHAEERREEKPEKPDVDRERKAMPEQNQSVFESLGMDDKKEKEKAGHKGRIQMAAAAGGFLFFTGAMIGILFMKKAGYLPWLDVSLMLGGLLVFGGLAVFSVFAWKKKRKKRTEPVLPVRGEGPGEDKWEEEYLWEKELEKEKEKRRALKESEPEEAVKKSPSVWRETFEGKGHKGKVEQIQEGKAEKRCVEEFGQTVILSQSTGTRCASLVSKEPGLLATITLEEDLTIIGKLPMAADAVIPIDTVSRIHAKIRKYGEEYYLSDLNSRNGTAVNGKMLKGEEEYCLCEEDEVHFGGAQYIFLK